MSIYIYWHAYTQISYQNSSSKGKSLNAVKDSRLSQNSSEKDVFFAHVNVIGIRLINLIHSKRITEGSL